MFHRDKWPLYVGILLPVLLILYIAATSYLPQFFIKPQYNFIYVAGDRSDKIISVENNHVVIKDIPVASTSAYPPSYLKTGYNQLSFYMYDVKADKNTKLAEKDVVSYYLDPSDKSPDGFKVGYASNGDYGMFPFYYGNSQQGIFLTGKGLTKRIIGNDRYNSYDSAYNFMLLGWVTK